MPVEIGLQTMVKAAVSHSAYMQDPETGKIQVITPHHPVQCDGPLYWEEDNTFRCDHATVPPEDLRAQAAVRHSICVLIIELAGNL